MAFSSLSIRAMSYDRFIALIPARNKYNEWTW